LFILFYFLFIFNFLFLFGSEATLVSFCPSFGSKSAFGQFLSLFWAVAYKEWTYDVYFVLKIVSPLFPYEFLGPNPPTGHNYCVEQPKRTTVASSRQLTLLVALSYTFFKK
jgi:hypothetical protein